jgi:hypothetical protein
MLVSGRRQAPGRDAGSGSQLDSGGWLLATAVAMPPSSACPWELGGGGQTEHL